MSKKPIRFAYQSVSEMKAASAKILPLEVNEYLNSGAVDDLTNKRNQSIFDTYSLIPKRLRGILHPDLSIDVFSQKYDVPFGAAPVGVQKLFHKEGELATAEACTHHQAPCILSTVSNLSFQIASKDCMPKPWFQLYPTDNYKITKQIIRNVEAAGAEVIVLTVDVPVLGKRKHNAKALLSKEKYKHLNFGNLDGLIHDGVNIHYSGMDWGLFSMIKEETNCKLVIKGILHPDDARLCVENGADGIIISNHGGRQMESNYSTLEALQRIINVVPKDYPTFMDGGIRKAEDILKALIIGAKMVFLGRPICYGLAIGGQAGVDHLLTMLKEDLIRCMKLMGIRTLSNLDSSQLIRKQ